MNRKALTLMVLALLIGIGLIVSPVPGLSRTRDVQDVGFVNTTVNATLDLSNGQVDAFWSDPNITSQSITEFGEGSSLKFANGNNGSDLYALIVCSEDCKWISFEFEAVAGDCMVEGNDGWSFYIDKAGQTVEPKDVNFVGMAMPTDDEQNDLTVEYSFSDGMVSIEVLRPFDTQDTAGFDIVYENESVVHLIFASDLSGAHMGSHTVYYLQTVVVDLSSGETPTPPPPPPPPEPVIKIFDVKLLLFIAALTGTGGFLVVHLLRRVIFSPIKHDVRVIYEE